jgi:hypothetical protein
MYFSDLNEILVSEVRLRVKNGEFTERGLAKLTGLSQPHLHNVLKGARRMSPSMSDLLLRFLHRSVLDLVGPDRMRDYLRIPDIAAASYAFLPVLNGLLGPGHPWPTSLSSVERFGITNVQIRHMIDPVVAKTGKDPEMLPLITESDMILLDQSVEARSQILSQALYAVKYGNTGMIRRVRLAENGLYLFGVAREHEPEKWQFIALEKVPIHHVIRARVLPITRDLEWRVS